MNQIINAKMMFIDTEYLLSIEDSILEEDKALHIVNLEDNSEFRMELTWNDLISLSCLVNEILEEKKKKLSDNISDSISTALLTKTR